MDESTEFSYSEPAKWERHSRGHTFGRLNLSRERLWFVLDQRIAIVETGFSVSLAEISKIAQSDNWLFRGAVNIQLVQILRIAISFKVDPESLVPGMEESVFQSNSLRLFLGSSRRPFLEAVREMGVSTHG
jgi:hypothetical protein